MSVQKENFEVNSAGNHLLEILCVVLGFFPRLGSINERLQHSMAVQGIARLQLADGLDVFS